MNNQIYKLSAIVSFSMILLIACKNSVSESHENDNYITGTEGYENGTLTDIEGNTYTTIQIGSQIWLGKNWQCEHKSDGISINGVALYNNNDEYLNEYGKLYTWQAAIDASPTGWHLPSIDEWQTLINIAGSNPFNGLIDGGNTGINLKLGGRRDSDGEFVHNGALGVYWTSNQSDATHATVKMIIDGENNIITDNFRKRSQVSVRYIKND